MTTLSGLADQAQLMLDDAGGATWSQSVIEGWVNEAIGGYSVHFPRLISSSINVTAGVRVYELPANFREMVSVAYPAGDSPPNYLGRLPFQRADFWQGDNWYDVVSRRQSGDADELWISRSPSAGESIGVLYQGVHDDGLASGGTVTVPGEHHPILLAHVYWKACLALLSAEQQSPTGSSSLLMGQLSSNADRAKRAYFQAIAQGLAAQEGRSGTAVWSTAETGRIY